MYGKPHLIWNNARRLTDKLRIWKPIYEGMKKRGKFKDFESDDMRKDSTNGRNRIKLGNHGSKLRKAVQIRQINHIHLKKASEKLAAYKEYHKLSSWL